eukprot:12405252-Karenia_brevis.AAC.1
MSSYAKGMGKYGSNRTQAHWSHPSHGPYPFKQQCPYHDIRRNVPNGRINNTTRAAFALDTPTTHPTWAAQCL